MSTIVCGSIHSEDFVLEQTLQTHQELTFELEQVVSYGNQAIMPMLRVRGDTDSGFTRDLGADPMVDTVRKLGDFEAESLFQMEWINEVEVFVNLITNSRAVILDAVGKGDEWTLRVLYPRREHFSTTYELCEAHGIDFEIGSVCEVEGDPGDRYGLTAQQHEVLAEAVKRGYYEVPKSVTLQELADEFEVSHQALSEQLRRAVANLVTSAVLCD